MSSNAVIEWLIAENIALRCLLGAGCDANDDGPHTIVKSDSRQFCADCGQMTPAGKSGPWMNEDRLERTIARVRAAAARDEVDVELLAKALVS